MRTETQVRVLAVVLLAFAGTVQAQTGAPRDYPRAPAPPVYIEPPFVEAPFIEPMGLEAAEMALEQVPMALEQVPMALERARGALREMNFLRGDRAAERALRNRTPRAAWAQGDPADSLYRSARAALNANEWRTASNLFAQIRDRYPKSTYRADAFYWDAFARYRLGGGERLRAALGLLEQMQKEYPQAAQASEAGALATRIRGTLARQGDSEAAERVAAIAAEAAEPTTPRPPRVPKAPKPPRPPRPSRESDEVPQGCSADDYEDKVAALNALLQMNSERALPILKSVIQRRDDCSAPLRRKAVFMVAQQNSPESAEILLQSVKTDPDPEVRKQGVFWLGQVAGERSVEILGDILRTSDDVELQKRAMFALSQHHSPKAAQIIRGYAERSDAPIELRKQAIFDIGQQQSAENSAFLRGLYAKVNDQEVRERILFSVSQMQGEGSGRWLLEIAANANEPLEMRKKALFWAGQQSETEFAAFAGLYQKMPDREMKKQLIYVFSQRNEPEAVDRLIEIAQKETDRELRKQAIFWLSQSNDPRAAKLLEDILNK